MNPEYKGVSYDRQKKMEIPKKLKIGGHKFDVLFPYVFTERTDLVVGQCHTEQNRIRISKIDGTGELISESGISVTLIHEILHAVDNITGHGVFCQNEKAIEGFSECMYQILVDNKEAILKFINGTNEWP